jgi:hypothetical protein
MALFCVGIVRDWCVHSSYEGERNEDNKAYSPNLAWSEMGVSPDQTISCQGVRRPRKAAAFGQRRFRVSQAP